MDTEAAKGLFTKYLKQENYRITPERFVVLNAALAHRGHFDADELFLRIKAAGEKVSRATVYNTLELLRNCGIISRYTFGRKQAHYEKAYGTSHHHHLICTRCGEIIEFTSDEIEKIQADVCKRKKFKVESHTFQIFGVCEKCQRS